jgi:hypothetical protein
MIFDTFRIIVDDVVGVDTALAAAVNANDGHDVDEVLAVAMVADVVRRDAMSSVGAKHLRAIPHLYAVM